MIDKENRSDGRKGKLSFLVKDSVLYGGAAALSKATTLITFPLLSNHFNVADFGVLDYFLTLANFLAVILIFGQDSAVARFFYEYEDTKTRRQVISQSLLFQLVCFIFIAPILFMLAPKWSASLVGAQGSTDYARIILLQLPFALLINFSQNLLKWTFSRGRFVAVSLGYTLVHAIIIAVAVLRYDVEIAAVLWLVVGNNFLFALLGVLFVRQWLVWPDIRMKHMPELLRFAIPLGIVGGLTAFSSVYERSFVAGLLGPVELGLYATATKITMLMAFVINAFQTAWGPFALSLHKASDAGQIYNLVLKVYTIFICLLVLLVTLLGPYLIEMLASPRYAGAATVVFPICFALAFNSVSWIFTLGITLSKRSELVLYGQIVGTSVTLIAILLLSSAFGLVGVGYGVLTGQVAKGLVSGWFAQTAYRLPWQYGRVAAVITATILFGSFAEWHKLVGHVLLGNALLTLGAMFVTVFGVAMDRQLKSMSMFVVRRYLLRLS